MEKKMPRMSRKNFNSKYYHVIIQGINKEYIFGTNQFIEEYKKILVSKLENAEITVLAYCIMSNHAHLLIFAEDVMKLSKFMQKVNTSYSIFYNKINKRVGYVFRDRYYTQEILDQKQLYNCIRYIHNNPVKARIVEKIDKYQHSSYLEFLDSNKRVLITEESIFIIFGYNKNYKEDFYAMHFQFFSEEEIFDIKDKNIQEFIDEIEQKYNKNILELKEDRNILRQILKEARNETDVKIVELAKIFDISKSKVWEYIKK